jgi:hypothetical protein
MAHDINSKNIMSTADFILPTNLASNIYLSEPQIKNLTWAVGQLLNVEHYSVLRVSQHCPTAQGPSVLVYIATTRQLQFCKKCKNLNQNLEFQPTRNTKPLYFWVRGYGV